MKSFVMFGRLFCYRISKDCDGYDCGLFSFKVIRNEVYGNKKALRLVIWRLAAWMEL